MISSPEHGIDPKMDPTLGAAQDQQGEYARVLDSLQHDTQAQSSQINVL